jgi:hypothetical protein
VWCGVVWCGVVWCGVVWCGVVWCGVVGCVVGCGCKGQHQGPGCRALGAQGRGASAAASRIRVGPPGLRQLSSSQGSRAGACRQAERQAGAAAHQRRGLDDEVVNRQLGAGGGQRLVDLRAGGGAGRLLRGVVGVGVGDETCSRRCKQEGQAQRGIYGPGQAGRLRVAPHPSKHHTRTPARAAPATRPSGIPW